MNYTVEIWYNGRFRIDAESLAEAECLVERMTTEELMERAGTDQLEATVLPGGSDP